MGSEIPPKLGYGLFAHSLVDVYHGDIGAGSIVSIQPRFGHLASVVVPGFYKGSSIGLAQPSCTCAVTASVICPMGNEVFTHLQ
jgi:hypothetical protein